MCETVRGIRGIRLPLTHEDCREIASLITGGTPTHSIYERVGKPLGVSESLIQKIVTGHHRPSVWARADRMIREKTALTCGSSGATPSAASNCGSG